MTTGPAILAAAVIAITNHVRVQHHVRPLRTDPRLAISASVLRCPSKPCFTHDGGILHRVEAVGIHTWLAGENLTWGWRLTPKEAVEAWLHSPPHRAILLNKHMTKIGVAVEESEGERVYAQDFVR